MYKCVFFFALVALTTSFKSKNCGGEYASLHINNIDDPLLLREGNTVNAEFSVNIRKRFPDPIKAKITLKRKVWFAWVPIPCINQVGSCTYKVTCDMINKMQTQNGGDIKHPCPADPQTVTRKISHKLPAIPGAVKTVGSGRYYLKVEIQNMSGRKMACAEGEIDVRT